MSTNTIKAETEIIKIIPYYSASGGPNPTGVIIIKTYR